MSILQQKHGELCASEFHPSQTRKARTQSWRRGRQLFVPFFKFWMGGTRSRIVFHVVFAKRSFIFPTTITNKLQNVSSPTPSRLYSISFVKTSAPGGLPLSRISVLTDFLKKNTTKKNLRRRIPVFARTLAEWRFDAPTSSLLTECCCREP